MTQVRRRLVITDEEDRRSGGKGGCKKKIWTIKKKRKDVKRTPKKSTEIIVRVTKSLTFVSRTETKLVRSLCPMSSIYDSTPIIETSSPRLSRLQITRGSFVGSHPYLLFFMCRGRHVLEHWNTPSNREERRDPNSSTSTS